MTTPTRARILVVDADRATRSLLARVLGDAGYVTECVPEAARALKALAGGSFAAAIVDIDLPSGGGVQLAAAITDRWPEVSVIASISPGATGADWAHLAVSDYLTKPFAIEDLAFRVERVLKRRHLAVERFSQEQQLKAAVRREARNARRVFLGAINSLSSALEAKDDYTRGHSERVSRIAVEVARTVGAASDDVRRIRLAGRLHDIGKIGVRESVLLKPDALSEEEYCQVKVHPVVGERILAPVLLDGDTVRIVRSHHEHYGGGGYPDGLVGSAIPLGARVMAVADAFDALTSDRPYRARLSPSNALAMLRTGAGRQWQPTLVEALAQRMEALMPIVGGREGRDGVDTGEAR